jgi:acyl-CoA thioesterase II
MTEPRRIRTRRPAHPGALEEPVSRQSRDIGTKYVFGGQVLGQALSAAQQTVEDGRSVHSLHAYFLHGRHHPHRSSFDVDRARDGHSFRCAG